MSRWEICVPGQQHLKFSREEFEGMIWIKSGSKAFFLHADSGAKVSVFAQS